MDVKIELKIEAIAKNADFLPSKEEAEGMFKELFEDGGFEVMNLNLNLEKL